MALADPVGGGAELRRRVAGAEVGEGEAAVGAADDPHQASALRSLAGSATAAGSGETPASIQRLAVM